MINLFKPIKHFYLPPTQVPQIGNMLSTLNDNAVMRPARANHFREHFDILNTNLWGNRTKVAVPVNGTTNPIELGVGELLWDTTTGASTFSELYFNSNNYPFTLRRRIWCAFRIYSVNTLSAQTLQFGLLGQTGNACLIKVAGATSLAMKVRCQGGTATSSAIDFDVATNFVNGEWDEYAIAIDPAEFGIVHFFKNGVDIAQTPINYVDVTTSGKFWTPYFYCGNSSAVDSQGAIDYIEIINEL